MKKSWKSFMTVTAAAAAMTAAMAFSSLAAVAKVDDDLPENRHIVSVASGGYETGFQIKAAHGADIYETTSYPIDKKADGEDEIGTVSQGKKIEFTLNSSLPKLLARYVVTASNAVIENRAQSGAVQVVAVDVQPGEYELRLKYLVDSLDRNEKGLRGVVWLENRDGGRSSVYSTTLRRNRTENFTRRFTVDTTHRRLHLDFLDFREKPLRPSVTVTGLEIDYIPTTSVAVDSLYRQQLDLRIFADEFLRAAIQADSL